MPVINRVVIIKESLLESFAKDLFTVVSLLAMYRIGQWLGGGLLEWMAVILWLVWAIKRTALRSEALGAVSAKKAKEIVDNLPENRSEQ